MVNGAKDFSCVYRWCGCLQAVVCAGKNFAEMFGEQKTYDAYQLIELDAYWGRKLAKCKVCGTFSLLDLTYLYRDS